MKGYEEKIKEYLENHRDEIANELCELVKIPSIAGTEGARAIIERVCEKFAKEGASVEKYDTYALATYGEGEHKIGLFSHADVVPEGKDWTMCEPFEGKIIGDDVFGRGSSDDKSAIVISLWILRAIRELKINLKSSLVFFIGANEETTMSDIFDYKNTHTPPDISMVLDSGFPVHLGDKGILWLECQKKTRLRDLICLKGGEAVNIILKEAEATVRYSDALYGELSRHGELEISREDGFIKINAVGISAHGANPKGTVNAGAIILGALLDCEYFSEGDKRELSLLYSLLSTYDGRPLGIEATDEVFGETTVTNGIIDISQDEIKFTLDIRHGRAYKQSLLVSKIASIFEEQNATVKVLKDGEPKAISADNKYVQVAMQAYREHTGNFDAQPRISVGGTYSRYLESSFEVGMTTKWNDFGLPSGHGGAHQADEHTSISGLVEATEVIMKMALKMDSELAK
jgi:succinyl-diaminopimelate desuccinylase